MILEGIVTTKNEDGSTNIAPMGPRVDTTMNRLLLRPYQTSTTYRNIKRNGHGVFHVTDDCLLMAQTAIGQPDPPPVTRPFAGFDGEILVDACRWYAFEVESLNDTDQRTEITARVVERGVQREFFGFNRAKHAVLEAAILATRLQLLPRDQVIADFERLRPAVEKTGGVQELAAFALLEWYIRNS